MFRPPCPWRGTAILKNLHSCWIDIRCGVRNLYRWIPVIWFDQNFDYSYLLDIMERKFRYMADALENGHLLHGKRHARELRICAELCRRMSADDYCLSRGNIHGGTGTTALISMKRSTEDARLLGRMIGKHLLTWWD
jgi:hypothetical protein